MTANHTPLHPWIAITDDGTSMTCKMPADEAIVEVKLTTGIVLKAMYCSNIMEPGDWEFAPVDENGDILECCLPDEIVAWRPVANAFPVLVEALKFYRDAWQYLPKTGKYGLDLSRWDPKEALLDDCGNTAREALEKAGVK